MAGMLYLVPTPIGNLGDISTRCRETLEAADFIAAEDTRVSLKLLNHLGIKKSLVSYYEHNKAFKGDKIVERILAGETCALVSDAGSPAISDPGEDLVKQCAAAGITVCAIPGPCAAITALSISGQNPLYNFIAFERLVMLIVADKAFFDAQMIQKLQRNPGILRSNEVGIFQSFPAADRDISQIADGSGDEI